MFGTVNAGFSPSDNIAAKALNSTEIISDNKTSSKKTCLLTSAYLHTKLRGCDVAILKCSILSQFF